MAVRVLRSAPSEHVEDLAYLMARLKGDPQAAELATDVEPAAPAAVETPPAEVKLAS
jgi:hypothetical protein